MDVYFSCPLSNEDLSGVLRTIILFLESLKFAKTCEILKKECVEFGFDVSFDGNNKDEVRKKGSSTEKAVDSSVFETSEETTVSNSVNVYYSDAPSFKHPLEKRISSTVLKRRSAGTCHPICESIGVQYDESLFANQSPRVCYEGATLASIPQNGSGENKMSLDCNKIWAFDDMLEKFKMLQVEHVKLMGITAELVKALQSSIVGQPERFYHLRERCKDVYPDLFSLMQNNQELTEPSKNENKSDVVYLTVEPKSSETKLEITRSASDTCLEQKTSFEDIKIERKESSKSLENVAFTNGKSENVAQGKREDGQKEAQEKKTRTDFFDIDYGRLKSDLINADERKKMLILQALRWRITKQSPEIRENVMASYIKHDLLCLQAPFREKLIFLESLYCPKGSTLPHPVQESIARLVNTFASLSAGRDYLCQYDNVLTHLLLPLILDKHHSSTKLSSISRDMLLATLQKLSLRYYARQKMILYGLTEFLINFLNENHGNISVYCLEYCTALMMNLCLHKEGRSRCMARTREVMRLIKNLLNSKHASNVMPYVSGTMYSLLGNRKMNTEAKLIDLASLLKYHIKQSVGEDRKQLEYILKIHLEGGSIKHPDPKMEGEELDLLEPELEEDDTVRSDICGEQVLADYKLHENIPFVHEDPFRNISATLRPRSVSTKTDISEKINCPHPSKCTVAEEKTEPATTTTETPNPLIPPGSPTESFSEVTKQFYHRPSKKKGVFDRRKLRFPKNPYEPKFLDFPSSIRNPSEARMSENGFPCACSYRTCEYGHVNANKYTCCCYEAMKAYIENTSTKERCDSCCQTIKNSTAETDAPKDDSMRKGDKKANSSDNGKLCNVMLEVQTEGGCNKACVLEEGGNCCKCYNVIFQSRPRIVRTPL